MGRKSHYIQTPNHKDIQFLNALRCSGVCSKEQALNFITANRLKCFVLDRTIQKASYIDDKGNRHAIYRISDDGRKWIAQNVPILADRKYYTSTGTEHDLRLMNKIISLTPEQRLTMRCESEIRDEFKAHLDKLLEDKLYDRHEELYNAMASHSVSMPDLAYGVNEYYEVITSSYGETEINAKIETVSMIGGNLEMERI
ncbi:MAG: hypothetical protein IKI97_09105 [Clostridia bacterium]|nr:hypothetical protein [Clostridia bacterium]